MRVRQGITLIQTFKQMCDSIFIQLPGDIIMVFAGKPPNNLGVNNGKL
ncbi:MAG: hypothetical protein ACYTXA_28695 [Nostoc sp.]